MRDARTLEPGIHLAEIAIDGLAETSDVEDALAMMGFDDVVFDATPETRDAGAWGPGREPETSSARHWRFVARLVLGLRLQDIPSVRWLFTHRISLDPYSTEKSSESSSVLKKGETYDLFFASWLKTGGARPTVEAALRGMNGFRPLKTACMKRLMRFPDRPGADGALWYALATWEGPDTIVVEHDPFYFYAVEPVQS